MEIYGDKRLQPKKWSLSLVVEMSKIDSTRLGILKSTWIDSLPGLDDNDDNKMIMMVIWLQASDAYHVFTSGQAKIQQGLLHEGYELISEALNLLNNVYGAMHPEIAACARLLARLSYIMGDYNEVGIIFIIYFIFFADLIFLATEDRSLSTVFLLNIVILEHRPPS